LSRLILFPDTNVFLQCRALHELPWGDAIQADEIELLIGAPVQDRMRSTGSRVTVTAGARVVPGKPMASSEAYWDPWMSPSRYARAHPK